MNIKTQSNATLFIFIFILFYFNSLIVESSRNTFSSFLNLAGNWSNIVNLNVFVRKWSNNSVVNKVSTTESRQVDKENSLQKEVEWNPVQNGFGPEFNNIDESKNNPVGQ